MISVITSFGPEGYELYGKGFIETFNRYWPKEVSLICAWEGPCPDPKLNGFDLLQVASCKEFLERHKTNPIIHGLHEAPPAVWGPKARRQGYSFRHNAYKFARKVFAVATAARFIADGKMFWIDADVISIHPICVAALDEILPDTVSLSYLKRPGYHSECGFVGYNLNRKECRKFIYEYHAQYASDAFLKDQYWDDCNQLDYTINRLAPHAKWITSTSRGNPFDNSVLGYYMRHNKGNKKAA